MTLTSAQLEAEVHFHAQAMGWCLLWLRKGRAKTQKEMACLCHVSRGEWQHLERARHSINECTKLRVCIALDMSILELDAQVLRVKEQWRWGGAPDWVHVPEFLAMTPL